MDVELAVSSSEPVEKEMEELAVCVMKRPAAIRAALATFLGGMGR